jgi:TolB protein
VLLFALACSLGPTPPSGPTGTLLAVQEDESGPTAVVVDIATGQRRLLKGVEGQLFPAAPDPLGTHALVIASRDDEQGHHETLTLIPLGEGDPIVLAPSAEMVRNPAFSPDGSWLVFESNANSFRDLYRVNRDGSDFRRLTDEANGSFEPQVSPDGQRIVFASSRDGNAELYTMLADGSDVVRLTDGREDDTKPGWLPDGHIAWLHQMGASKLVWRMDANGENKHVVRRRNEPTLDHDWAISPDGKRMVITMQISARELDLVVVNMEDKTEVTIGGDGVDEMPSWSPDGQWLVWTSAQTGDTELWLARADGSDPRVVAARPGADWLPRWLPAAK